MESMPAPSPAYPWERVGGEAGLSSRMRRACAAVWACKPRRALQVRDDQPPQNRRVLPHAENQARLSTSTALPAPQH